MATNSIQDLFQVLQERFRLDALGLVSMLGESTFRDLYGRLENPLILLGDFLPTVAIHTAFDNSMLKPLHGFTLYNISDDIKTTDLSAWFTRWLSTQDFTDCSATLRIDNNGSAADVLSLSVISAPWVCKLGLFNSAFTPWLIDDPVSVICQMGMVVATIARASIIDSCRVSLENQAKNAKSGGNKSDPAKILVTLPGGQLVRIVTTKGIAKDCLLTGSKPRNTHEHVFQRLFGWLGVSVHVLTLGMCTSFHQLCILGSLIFCTVMRLLMANEDAKRTVHYIGNSLTITFDDSDGRESRAKMFARLRLTRVEKQSLQEWGLMPKETDQVWWDTFEDFCADAKVDATVLDTWHERLSEAHRTRKEDGA